MSHRFDATPLGILENFTHLITVTKNAVQRHQAFICFLAVFLGVVATIVAKILLVGINFFTNLFYFQRLSLESISPSEHQMHFFAVIPPILGGIIVGLMARWGSSAIRGHGIPEAMDRILTNESRIQKRATFLKPLSSAIAIGSGGPFGAEGPIIATGGGLGSVVGQWIKVNPMERRILLSCGAAAGMTAIFGTPLAAVLLAIELLLFEFCPRSYIPVALSAAIAATLHFSFFGPEPFFNIPTINAPNLNQFICYLFSGVIFGFIAVTVTKLVYFLESSFEKLPLHWMWWPALGGLAVGAIGLLEPKSLGVGYSNIDNALTGNLTVAAATSLLLWKLSSWAIALSSGTSGGTLAPLLTIGSLSGMILGSLAKLWLPNLALDISTLALIGMAAVFAGASRSLLASIIFALEASRQPMGLVPLLGACSIAYLISHRLMKTTIMTEKISRRGIEVPYEYFPRN